MLGDRLSELAEAGSTTPQIKGAPAGWEPGVKYEPDGSRIVTLPPSPALADESGWAEAVKGLGVDVPDGFRVRLVEAKYDPAAWHRDAEGADAVTRPIWRYRFVVEVAPARIDVAELLAAVRHRGKAPEQSDAGAGFVFAVGDMQLGKSDGDGSAGTVGELLPTLPEDDRAALVDALADHRLSSAAIERILKAEGLRVGAGALGRHRRKDCKCSATV